MVCLYPNQVYHAQPNPVPAAEKLYLPAEPNGLYIEGAEGLSRLYVVAAEKPLPELEAECAQCRQWGIRLDRRKRLADLQQQLDALVDGRVERASGWALELEVR
jgi:hypothetical protein